MPVAEVPIAPLPPDRFREVLTSTQAEQLDRAIASGREVLEGRVVWNVNSTAQGGGVAEMLRSLIAYTRGAQVDARWLVIEGNPDFFQVTKRIHNHLHGSPGDGGELGDAEREIYTATCEGNVPGLAEMIRPGDVALLHDPQTAGLVDPLRERGAHVVWRAHIGLDLPNDLSRAAWSFLRPFVQNAEAWVFSREAFVWEGLDRDRIAIVPPSIDAFSPKNQDLDPETVTAVLEDAGIVGGDTTGPATFTREDGTPGRVDRQAKMWEDEQLANGVPLVVQVSRWDRLKDPFGVMDGFARGPATATDAHLVVAGPDVSAVADDPEGLEVLEEAVERREALPEEIRRRVHLVALPMDDAEENAAMVNALQRRASVVVQKSLAEGFGLTVAEAMWKGRPVVASSVGGIQDQIVDGETGVLVPPTDLEAYGSAVTALLEDPDRAERVGRAARDRVRDEFLGPRHLAQYVDLFGKVVAAAER